MLDAWALICKANSVALIENGHHYFVEIGVDEIFGYFPDYGVGIIPPASLAFL